MIKAVAGFVNSSDWQGNHYKVAAKDLVWRPAAYAIVVRDGKILLTKQRQAYHLPGGGVDLGESPDVSVIREVKEETGLIVRNPKLVDLISGFFTWEDSDSHKSWHYHSLLLFYVCEFVGGELSTDGFEDDEAEFGELAEWVPLEQLGSLKSDTTVNWQELVKKYSKA